MDPHDRLFTLSAFLIQILLLTYFIFRKLDFERTLKWGWIIYAMAIPALFVSIILIRAGKPWSFWLGGVIFTTWAIFGYIVDIAWPVPWRSPIYLPVFIPFVVLYLGSLIFYWWPLGMIQRGLCYIYAILFVTSTYFNVTSHQ